jgi:hypothetical protein
MNKVKYVLLSGMREKNCPLGGLKERGQGISPSSFSRHSRESGKPTREKQEVKGFSANRPDKKTTPPGWGGG